MILKYIESLKIIEIIWIDESITSRNLISTSQYKQLISMNIALKLQMTLKGFLSMFFKCKNLNIPSLLQSINTRTRVLIYPNQYLLRDAEYVILKCKSQNFSIYKSIEYTPFTRVCFLYLCFLCNWACRCRRQNCRWNVVSCQLF